MIMKEQMPWILFSLLILPLASVHAQQRTVDFRYAPARSMAAICLPDDWQKTLVTERGALAYDFGPGPYARALTEISVGIQGKELTVRTQTLRDARIPVVTTELFSGDITVRQDAFALILDSRPIAAPRDGATRVHRSGGVTGAMGWASPAGEVDPAFRNVAWGTNRPIRYSVDLPPGGKRRVALGLCESYKPGPGTRLLELRVEGAPPLTVDPMADGRKNSPHLFLFDAHDENGDGSLAVEVHPSPRSPDPNVFLNVFWVFPEGAVLSEDSLVRGRLSRQAEVYVDCGRELEETAPGVRIDGILTRTVGGPGTPVVRVQTTRECRFDAVSGTLLTNDHPFVLSRPRIVSATRTANEWLLEFPANSSRAEVMVVHGPAERTRTVVMQDLEVALERARTFWKGETAIPFGRITVPDRWIQYLLDVNVRNIYQVRERVDSCLQFQPGPSVYRGLWSADALFIGTPVLMLGDTSGANQYLQAIMRLQKPNGQLHVIVPHVSMTETPILVTAVCRYALFVNSRQWLSQHWDAVKRGIGWLKQTRETTLAAGTPYHGLMPPGFVDGGISAPTADYGSAWWAMTALETAVRTAQWLGKSDDAVAWQNLFDNFWASFLIAARRDLRRDSAGTLYLPVGVADTTSALPQRGQYTFLFPIPYSRYFLSPDSVMRSIVNGNLTMLDRVTEEGVIAGSGWMRDGVWPWLGGIHGMAHHWFGNNGKALDLLYSYANHASPAGVWVEEQQPRAVGSRTAGDVNDAEASAVFIHAVRNLLVCERNDNLDLLSGIPAGWLDLGATIELNGVLTEFGTVSLKLSISPDGSSGTIHLSPVDGRGWKGRPILFLNSLKERGYIFRNGNALPDLLPCRWKTPVKLEFVREGRR
jgi:hypothetical protein